jgi:hypothetical protein
MSYIDFLPENYRQRDVHRKNRWTRTVVVLAFVGLLAAGSFALRKKRASVAAELDVARQSFDTMMAQTTNLSQEIAQLSEARGQANLITFLRHPWSRARIVAAIVQDWPQPLVLEELRIQREGQGGIVSVPPATPIPGQPTKPAAETDLSELRRESQNQPTVVLLSGLMRDQAVLHRYLAELGKIDLFSNVELLGMVPADAEGTLRFNVRLSLAPGYGQTGGPTSPPQPLATKAAGHHVATPAQATQQPLPPPFSLPPIPKFLFGQEEIVERDAAEPDAKQDAAASRATEAEGAQEADEEESLRTSIAEPAVTPPRPAEEDDP